MQGSGAKLVLRSSRKYVQDIRRRLGENAAACEQRQKRLDRLLMEQQKSHEAEEVKFFLSSVNMSHVKRDIYGLGRLENSFNLVCFFT